MRIAFIGGPLHRRTVQRDDLVTEADAMSAVKEPSYSYKHAVTADGAVVEATFAHVFATQADYDAIELELNDRVHSASRIF
jgi:hypothetical protein